MQILLQKKGGLKLNSVTTMYYVSPCCFVFLLVPWLFLEFPKLTAREPLSSLKLAHSCIEAEKRNNDVLCVALLLCVPAAVAVPRVSETDHT